MPELRIDPICGRRVYIAEDRAGRPSDFVEATPRNNADALARRRVSCPFCAGHEAATPAAAAETLDGQGRWRVRVVPNKFPAVAWGEKPTRAGEGGSSLASGGVHEVIVEAPEHLVDVVDMGPDQFALALAMCRDRLRRWAGDARLRHAIVFKNSGPAAGASLEHVHSQLLALPYVPEAVQAELAGAARHYELHRRCAFCDLVQGELAAGERVVLRRDGYLAACAVAGRQPYETWILPERHAARFDRLDDAEFAGLATTLQDVLGRLRAEFHRHNRDAAYNLILHTGPYADAADDSYHWHWELVPRSTHLAGLEWGGGVFINPVSPERAAARLRQVPAVSSP